MSRRPLYAALALPTLAVAMAAGLSVASNVPRPWSPTSLLAVIPAMLLPWPATSAAEVQLVASITGALTVALAFVAWSYPCVQTERIPRLSLLAFTNLGVADAIWLAGGWSYGVHYQGRMHTLIVIGCNVLAGLASVGLFLRNRRAPSAASNLAFHTVCFVALGFCAFPWLGELI